MNFNNIQKRDIINMIKGATIDCGNILDWDYSKLEEQSIEYLVSFYNRKFGSNIELEPDIKNISNMIKSYKKSESDESYKLEDFKNFVDEIIKNSSDNCVNLKKHNKGLTAESIFIDEINY